MQLCSVVLGAVLSFGFVPGVSGKPLSLSCVLNILLLHIVLCEILNEREDFFCTELTLSFWSVLVCCSFER